MRSSTRKRAEDSSRSQHSNFGLRCPSLRAGIFNIRNLIAIFFLIALASGKKPEWTLTTQKSGIRTKILGAVANAACLWKDTSTITVRYDPKRTYVNMGGNNHKYCKVNRFKNEWFTITKVLEHDKANNRIKVQIYGMKNRWIYYLENEGTKFIEHLRDTEGTVNLKHKLRNPKIAPNMGGSVQDLPTPEDLKRGDVENGIYGFRVALQKEGAVLGSLSGILRKAKKNFSALQDFFDAVSIRVHIQDGKVNYIQIPNSFGTKKATIEKIDLFDSTKNSETVVLRLKDHIGSKIVNMKTNSAADRKLFLGGNDTIAKEGRKLLKFLIDHAKDPDAITDDSNFKKFKAGIRGDWKCACHTGNRRRLVEAAYYSFIGFNMMLMCCILLGISFAYRAGTHEANRGPVRW